MTVGRSARIKAACVHPKKKTNHRAPTERGLHLISPRTTEDCLFVVLLALIDPCPLKMSCHSGESNESSGFDSSDEGSNHGDDACNMEAILEELYPGPRATMTNGNTKSGFSRPKLGEPVCQNTKVTREHWRKVSVEDNSKKSRRPIIYGHLEIHPRTSANRKPHLEPFFDANQCGFAKNTPWFPETGRFTQLRNGPRNTRQTQPSSSIYDNTRKISQNEWALECSTMAHSAHSSAQPVWANFNKVVADTSEGVPVPAFGRDYKRPGALANAARRHGDGAPSVKKVVGATRPGVAAPANTVFGTMQQGEIFKTMGCSQGCIDLDKKTMEKLVSKISKRIIRRMEKHFALLVEKKISDLVAVLGETQEAGRDADQA